MVYSSLALHMRDVTGVKNNILGSAALIRSMYVVLGQKKNYLRQFIFENRKQKFEQNSDGFESPGRKR